MAVGEGRTTIWCCMLRSAVDTRSGDEVSSRLELRVGGDVMKPSLLEKDAAHGGVRLVV